MLTNQLRFVDLPSLFNLHNNVRNMVTDVMNKGTKGYPVSLNTKFKVNKYI